MIEPVPKIEVIKLCPASFLVRVKPAGVAWVFNPWPDITKFIDRLQLSYNGVVYPDKSIQQYQSCNLIEFPLFHAMYVQGMTMRGEKPILVGTAEQLIQAGEAFRRGVYGFFSESEMLNCDLPEQQIKVLMNEIKGLASNQIIKEVDELLELVTLQPSSEQEDSAVATYYNGLHIWKKESNIFGLSWQDEEVLIDCNLGTHETYHPPLKIDVKTIPPSLYQIIDSGEEDGFAPRSCMHTVIRWRDKTICIDLPMNASYLLDKISVSPTEIDAVLFTHNHDDHIGDFALLLRMDKKVTVLCPAVIWRSILLKASHVFGMSVDELSSYVDYQPLQFGRDKEFEYCGLHIEAYPSIHSVPCAIYRLRAYVDGQWKVYSHLSDILNFKRCSTLIDSGHVDKTRFDEYKEFLLRPSQLKKVDVGTADGTEDFSVHGSWRDFTSDVSEHIILSHIQREKLDPAAMLSVGQLAAVGCAHSLDNGARQNNGEDVLRERAARFLSNYFALLLDDNDGFDNRQLRALLQPLLNHEIDLIKPNTLFIKQGQDATFVDLIVSGIGSVWRKNNNTWKHIANVHPGDLVGDMGVLNECKRNASVRADTYMHVLRVPAQPFRAVAHKLEVFSKANDNALKKIWRQRELLQCCGLLQEQDAPVYLQNRIAREAVAVTLKRGESLHATSENGAMYIALDREAFDIRVGDRELEQFWTPAVFGEHGFMTGECDNYRIIARTAATLLKLDRERFNWLREIPILKLRLRELVEQRRVQ